MRSKPIIFPQISKFTRKGLSKTLTHRSELSRGKEASNIIKHRTQSGRRSTTEEVANLLSLSKSHFKTNVSNRRKHLNFPPTNTTITKFNSHSNIVQSFKLGVPKMQWGIKPNTQWPTLSPLYIDPKSIRHILEAKT